jgi:hypothetical protein
MAAVKNELLGSSKWKKREQFFVFGEGGVENHVHFLARNEFDTDCLGIKEMLFSSDISSEAH